MDTYVDWNYGAPMGVFGFIILIVLINAVASVFRTRAKQELLREAIRSGHDIDPEMLESLQEHDRQGSNALAGMILMAVAAGLVFMGYQIQKVEVDEPIFDIMLGVASIPFFIGVVLLISSLFQKKEPK